MAKKWSKWTVILLAGFVLAGCTGGKTEQTAQQAPVAPASPSVYNNGTYEGRSTDDQRGAYGLINLVIENDRIVRAQYTEMLASGEPKGAAYPYQLGIEATPQFEQALVETQDPEKIDVVAGATATLDKLKEAAKDALQKAKK